MGVGTLRRSVQNGLSPDQGRSTPFGSNERASAERVIALGLLTVRAVHIAQGAICLVAGWKAYRRPRLALGLLLASGIETTLLARRAWRHRSYTNPGLAWTDTGFGVGGLLVMAATTAPDDRTAWLNWMCPLTFGTTVGGAAAIGGGASNVVPALLAGTYVVTVRDNIRSGGSQMATALANTTSYLGFHLAARSFGGRLRGDSAKLEKARDETLRERERFAAEQQRNREHRLLHDSVLQTLELIAADESLPVETIRHHARREAATLRRAISGDGHGAASLVLAVQELADEFTRNGLRIDLALIDPNVRASPEVSEAFLGALREALTNAAKYSGVDRVVVNLDANRDGIRFVVRDHGNGFDPKQVTGGFGIKHSIIARLTDVGGTAVINSSPGRGTRVELWAPN